MLLKGGTTLHLGQVKTLVYITKSKDFVYVLKAIWEEKRRQMNMLLFTC